MNDSKSSILNYLGVDIYVTQQDYFNFLAKSKANKEKVKLSNNITLDTKQALKIEKVADLAKNKIEKPDFSNNLISKNQTEFTGLFYLIGSEYFLLIADLSKQEQEEKKLLDNMMYKANFRNIKFSNSFKFPLPDFEKTLSQAHDVIKGLLSNTNYKKVFVMGKKSLKLLSGQEVIDYQIDIKTGYNIDKNFITSYSPQELLINKQLRKKTWQQILTFKN